MISQANRRPGHAACLSAIRSKPFAPVFTFQKTTCTCALLHYIANYAKLQQNFIFGLFFRKDNTFFTVCPENTLLSEAEILVAKRRSQRTLGPVIRDPDYCSAAKNLNHTSITRKSFNVSLRS